jgi:hypothetical protein
MPPRSYFLPSQNQELPANKLSTLDQEEIDEIVRHWFFQHYEHPDNRTPFDSGEGGYIWIWGGPYDAREEIYSEFLDILDQTSLDPIIIDLEDHSTLWGPAESPDDYDDEYIENIASISDFYAKFTQAMDANTAMSSIEPISTLQQKLNRMLFADAITLLETYLSTAFINTTINSNDYKKNFVESTPEFQNEKISISEIYKTHEGIEARIHKYLSEVLRHNLAKVKLMYKDTLNITFPEDLKDLYRAISIRHDIVHRNGFTKDGAEHQITPTHLSDIRGSIKLLVSTIDQQLKDLPA